MERKKTTLENSAVCLFKQALEGLGEGIKDLCNVAGQLSEENKQLAWRVSELEAVVIDLSDRLDRAELQAGVNATAKIAEGTFTGSEIPQLEAEAE